MNRFSSHLLRVGLAFAALLLLLITGCSDSDGNSGTATYTVAGTVSGLSGTVVLRNNGGDDLTVSANGAVTFATVVAHGDAYSVTVQTQPSGQTCTVTSGSGTVTAAVTSVAVTCVMNLPATPTLSLTFGIKQLEFAWGAVTGATYYQLYENPDGASGFTQVGANIAAPATSTTIEIAVHRHNWANASYLLAACHSGGCGPDSTAVATAAGVLQAIGFVKASNTGGSDSFGYAVALSDDGATLAVGAQSEDSNATGINGDQTNNSAPYSGAVYLY